MSLQRIQFWMPLLFCLGIGFFPLHASESVSSIIIEPVTMEQSHEIGFTVSVLNEKNEPVELKTDHGEIVNYRLGNYDSSQLEGLLIQRSFIIPPGKQESIGFFKHDLSAHPSPNTSQAVIHVEVKGVGTTSYTFDFEKPGFLENLMGGIFGAKGEDKGQGAGNLGQGVGADPRVRPEQEQGAHMGAPLRTATQDPGSVFEQQQQTVVPPAETPINQTPTSTTPPPQTEPEAQTPVEEPAPEEPSAPVINPPAQLPADTTPPSVPSVNSLPQAVNATSVILSGAKELNSSIWINGSERVTVNNSTSWNFDMPLAEGTNLLRVESRDAAGNVSSAITVSVIKDTLAPTIQSIQVTETTTTTATIQLHVNEKVTATLTYQAENSNQAMSNAGGCQTLSEVCTFTLIGLMPGTRYTFFATVRDQVQHAVESTVSELTTGVADSSFGEFQALDRIPESSSTLFLDDDLNGDGISELILLALGPDPANAKHRVFYVAYSDAAGNYPQSSMTLLGESLAAKATGVYGIVPFGDVNQDGIQDILFINSQILDVYVSDSTNHPVTFNHQQRLDLSVDQRYTADGFDQSNWYPDFNGDGLTDLMLRNDRGPSLSTYLLLSDRTNQGFQPVASAQRLNFSLPTDVETWFSQPLPVPFSDVNGDGMSEVAALIYLNNARTHMKILLSPDFNDNNAREFIIQEPITSFSSDPNTRGFGYRGNLEDIDHNGVIEFYGLVVTGPGSSPGSFTTNAAVLYFDTDGTPLRTDFALPFPQSRQKPTVLSDLNQDGVSELSWPVDQSLKAEVYIYYSKSDGRFDLLAAPAFILEAQGVRPMWDQASLQVRKRRQGQTVHRDLWGNAWDSAESAFTQFLWQEK